MFVLLSINFCPKGALALFEEENFGLSQMFSLFEWIFTEDSEIRRLLWGLVSALRSFAEALRFSIGNLLEGKGGMSKVKYHSLRDISWLIGWSLLHPCRFQ